MKARGWSIRKLPQLLTFIKFRVILNSVMLSKFELELLRPWVSGRITALLGGFNPTVVNTVLECIAQSLNRQATTGTLIQSSTRVSDVDVFYLTPTTFPFFP